MFRGDTRVEAGELEKRSGKHKGEELKEEGWGEKETRWRLGHHKSMVCKVREKALCRDSLWQESPGGNRDK